jgi:hypothetical protein
MFWDQDASGGITVSGGVHSSHVTQYSVSSYFEICIHCGNTDLHPGGWDKWEAECPDEPEQHRVARLLGANTEFINSTLDNI